MLEYHCSALLARKYGLDAAVFLHRDKRDSTCWYSPSDEILVLYGVNLQLAKSPCQQADSPQTEGETAPALPEYIPESNIPPISPWREAGGGGTGPRAGPRPPPAVAAGAVWCWTTRSWPCGSRESRPAGQPGRGRNKAPGVTAGGLTGRDFPRQKNMR